MGISYEDAVDQGYDGPPPGWERRQRAKYGCGGYASATGHCGATDCPTCYPGSWDQDDDDHNCDDHACDDCDGCTECDVDGPWVCTCDDDTDTEDTGE